MNANVNELPEDVFEVMLSCACACGSSVGHGGGS